MENPNNVFMTVLEKMRETYPNRKIRMSGTKVCVDGVAKFDTYGYNLLYNLKRLADAIGDELI